MNGQSPDEDTLLLEGGEASGVREVTTDEFSGCLRATADVFFDALVQVDSKSSLQLINHMSEKIALMIIEHHVKNAHSTSYLQSSTDVRWINILQGFTSSILPSKLTTQTLHLLTIVDILENINLCKRDLYETKTFYDLYQLLSSMSWFEELQEDAYHQKIIRELQEETRNQELMCHHTITRSMGRQDVKTFCDSHPLSEFCLKTIKFISSVVEEKFNNQGVKVHTTSSSSHDLPSEQNTPSENNLFDLDKHSWAETTSQPSLDSESDIEDSDVHSSSSQEEDSDLVDTSCHLPDTPSDDKMCSSRRRDRKTLTLKSSPNQRSQWTPEELTYLRKGAKKHHGHGRWMKISQMFPFQHRSPMALKAKWRIIATEEKARRPVVKAKDARLKLRKRMAWSEKEVEWLEKGVKTYGSKNWQKIIESYPFPLGTTKIRLAKKWYSLHGPGKH